ncbi:UNVERIFIED_CONTAM: glycine--tRNA ligase, partial [Salmonella enterica subsp. enterica serovar Weltevreden]
PANIRQYEHPKEKLSHYSKRTVDLEYRFGFAGGEWGELMGVANRTDYDLSSHSEASGQSLTYFDQATGERYTPYVIEPSFGLTRAMMAFLVDAYVEEQVPNAKGGTDVRTVL